MYNKQQTIGRAIYSVLEQINYNAESIQLIIVDDGSTDGSRETVVKILNSLPQSSIKLHWQKNSGVSAARNTGIELADNEFVTFLDADDTYDAHFLNEITGLINEYPESSAYCTSYRFINSKTGRQRNAILKGLDASKDRQILDNFFYSATKGDLPVTSSSVCIRKSILDRVGGFPRGENMGEDQALWSLLALSYSIAISKKVSANYFQETTNSLMQTVAPECEMPFSQRLQKKLDEGSITEQMAVSVKRYIAGHLLDLVRRNIASGNLVTAKNLLEDGRSRADFQRWLRWRLTLSIKNLCD
jgi:glycosyltransferase involved in cell wall biosynthesis